MANNTGATCVRCGKGRYKVLDLNDDIFGELHCDNCRHYVKFNQDLGKHLSRQAQAVLDAYGNQIGGTDAIMGSERRGVAAALRAAADQVAPSDLDEPRNYLPMAMECQRIRKQLIAIAAELENNG